MAVEVEVTWETIPIHLQPCDHDPDGRAYFVLPCRCKVREEVTVKVGEFVGYGVGCSVYEAFDMAVDGLRADIEVAAAKALGDLAAPDTRRRCECYDGLQQTDDKNQYLVDRVMVMHYAENAGREASHGLA